MVLVGHVFYKRILANNVVIKWSVISSQWLVTTTIMYLNNITHLFAKI